MKCNALSYLGFTTLILIIVIVFSVLNFPFRWLFFLTLFGQALLVFTVYKVLKDDYSTTKTFKDFYEDRPDLKENDRQG